MEAGRPLTLTLPRLLVCQPTAMEGRGPRLAALLRVHPD
jgi:hypothetical protein